MRVSGLPVYEPEHDLSLRKLVMVFILWCIALFVIYVRPFDWDWKSDCRLITQYVFPIAFSLALGMFVLS
jgi:hypothetical protein